MLSIVPIPILKDNYVWLLHAHGHAHRADVAGFLDHLGQRQAAVRLFELGPRMTLRLHKIQEGFGDGEVIYHAHVQKSEEEAQHGCTQRNSLCSPFRRRD